MNRPPIGVILLGVYALLAGIAGIFTGLVLMGTVAFGPDVTGNGTTASGLLSVVVGVVYLAVAFGVWSLRTWALLFGLFVSAIGMFNAVVVLMSTGSVATGTAVLLLPAVTFWYLSRPDIRAAFTAPED